MPYIPNLKKRGDEVTVNIVEFVTISFLPCEI